MTISQYPPEGEFNRCPSCDQLVSMQPDDSMGDVACPECGVPLWFQRTDFGVWLTRQVNPLPVTADGDEIAPGDRVRIIDGRLRGRDGEVLTVDSAGKVWVTMLWFGRQVPIPLDGRQLEID